MSSVHRPPPVPEAHSAPWNPAPWADVRPFETAMPRGDAGTADGEFHRPKRRGHRLGYRPSPKDRPDGWGSARAKRSAAGPAVFPRRKSDRGAIVEPSSSHGDLITVSPETPVRNLSLGWLVRSYHIPNGGRSSQGDLLNPVPTRDLLLSTVEWRDDLCHGLLWRKLRLEQTTHESVPPRRRTSESLVAAGHNWSRESFGHWTRRDRLSNGREESGTLSQGVSIRLASSHQRATSFRYRRKTRTAGNRPFDTSQQTMSLGPLDELQLLQA